MKWKFWEKKEKVYGEANYVLKRQSEKGGMEKVMNLADPAPIEEIYESLEPGTYALHKYMKGKSGFEVVWGPVEVAGEKTQRAPRAEKPLVEEAALPRYVEMLRSLAVLKEKASLEYELVKGFFEGGSGGTRPPEGMSMEDWIDDLEQKRFDRFAKMAGRYGYTRGESTSGEAMPEYEGKFPIWLHPKGIPMIVDESMEKIEKRLARWGMLGTGTQQESGDELLKFPKKPGE